MKLLKTIIASLILGICCAAVLPACSSKEDEPTIPNAENVAGTYKGNMTCSVMGQESVFEDMSFIIDAKDDSNVDVVVPSFGNPPMQVAGFVIPSVKVTGGNGKYSLASTDFEQTSNGKKISGIIQGSYANDIISIKFTLNYGAMPMPMICSFSAPKL